VLRGGGSDLPGCWMGCTGAQGGAAEVRKISFTSCKAEQVPRGGRAGAGKLQPVSA